MSLNSKLFFIFVQVVAPQNVGAPQNAGLERLIIIALRSKVKMGNSLLMKTKTKKNPPQIIFFTYFIFLVIMPFI